VIQKTLLWCQSRHADINAGLFRVTPGIGSPDSPEPRSGGIEQNHIDTVVVLRRQFGLELFVCPPFHSTSILARQRPVALFRLLERELPRGFQLERHQRNVDR
jgi:hypothetical protein